MRVSDRILNLQLKKGLHKMKVKELRDIVNALGSEHDDLDLVTIGSGRYYRPIKDISVEQKDIAFHPAIKESGDSATKSTPQPMALILVNTSLS